MSSLWKKVLRLLLLTIEIERHQPNRSSFFRVIICPERQTSHISCPITVAMIWKGRGIPPSQFLLSFSFNVSLNKAHPSSDVNKKCRCIVLWYQRLHVASVSPETQTYRLSVSIKWFSPGLYNIRAKLWISVNKNWAVNPSLGLWLTFPGYSLFITALLKRVDAADGSVQR